MGISSEDIIKMMREGSPQEMIRTLITVEDAAIEALNKFVTPEIESHMEPKDLQRLQEVRKKAHRKDLKDTADDIQRIINKHRG